ncbi:hypothetical protein BBJ29_002583 [Phytophthora kernoviae]|uniref:FYVE-type domain-containing protein n=1 Tax=Phytophthora kernoviae TaxID=325452 RepID=A0A3F2RP01_9STRA|nr:hypothetical protein BBJ29_002583 [Phytophthora kernoviae]RLN61432.1 hypothetical protein BBP00_00005436 [Phytophthora kernoviae]
MGKSKLPPNVFPPLQLSDSEKQAIVNYTDELIAETLQASENFIAHHRRLNPERWKYVKTQDQLHVYRSRRRKSSASLDPPEFLSLSEMSFDSLPSSDGASASHNKSSMSSGAKRHDSDYLTDDSILERARPERVPLIVITGKMEGTVEDAAFGALADNEARWRLRDAHIGDHYDDQKILATIESPTVDDPFRYALDRVPELSEFGVIRSRISACFILRHHSESSVEVFTRAFNDMGGDMWKDVIVSLFKDTLLSVGGLVQCAYVKKLKWQMAAREREAREHATSLAAKSRAPTHCAGCHHSLSKFSKLVQSGSACQVCRRVFCSKCSITKRVGVDFGNDGAIMEKDMDFCGECMGLAMKLSPWSVALETLPEDTRRLTKKHSSLSTSKSMSASSSGKPSSE